MIDKREHEPGEEVHLKHAEKVGNLHKFIVGAEIAADGASGGNEVAIGNLDVMKAGSWYMSLEILSLILKAA